MTPSITAIVLTHNSDRYLEKCLKSLAWCDAILVLDDNSTDNTQLIAKSLNAKVVNRPVEGDWAAQRNAGLKLISSTWAFFVDSDEEVPAQLALEIQKVITQSKKNGFYFHRLDFFLGSPLRHGETSQVKLLRLAKVNAGVWARPVHEYWDVKGSIGLFKHPLLHNRDITISELIDRFNHYTDIDAIAQTKEGKSYHHWHLLKPWFKFAYNYKYLLGFLDGTPGLFFAWLMSFYSLSLRVKLWEKSQS